MSSDRIEELRKAWGFLGMRASSNALRVYQLDRRSKEISASLANEGFRGLLVSVADGERVIIPRELSPLNGVALVADVVHLNPPGAVAVRYLHVWCRDSEANQAFEAFCALLWDSVADAEVGTALRKCSDEFRRLLSATLRPADKSAIGLLGELLFLRELIEGAPGLLSAWTGPTQARHDFRAGAAAVEVKTTLRSDARNRRVRISDIDQLEPPLNGRLHLHLVRLERVMSGSVSLESVAREIESRLRKPDVEDFRTLISAYQSDPDWSTGFELKEQVTYAVTSDFPCLTTAKLANGHLDVGISRVCYDLSLENAASFEVPIEAAIESLKDCTNA